MKRKPDIVFIGLKRSGSTFLRSYFESHPAIVWTRNAGALLSSEEIDEEAYLQGLPGVGDGQCLIDMHEHLSVGQFTSDREQWQQRRFEPYCRDWPRFVHFDSIQAARNVKRVVPDARILMVLRNQHDWLRTHYKVFFHHLPADRNTFVDFLNTPEGKLIASAAHYDRMLDTYLELFAPERVCVLLLEQISNDRESVLRRVCGFAGVDYRPLGEARARYNRGPGMEQHHASHYARHLEMLGPLGRMVRPALRAVYRRLPHAVRNRDIISRQDAALINAIYAGANQRLSARLGLDLAAYGYPA